MSCEKHRQRAAYMREWTRKNKDRLNAERRAKKRTEEELAKGRERDRRWREGHPDHARALAAERERQYRVRSPERSRESVRKYAAKNPEKVRQWSRQARVRRMADPERAEVARAKRREYMRRLRQTPGFKARKVAEEQVRRARKQGAEGVATVAQIAARVAYFGGLCYLCGTEANTIDHVIPLARGGTNWAANLRPACRSCNSRKGGR